MIPQEVPIGQQKFRLSPPVLIVGGILVVTGLFLLLPSSRTSRTIKAREKLAKEYVGPRDISHLYVAYLVSNKNQLVKINAADKAEILVFAPGPKDQFSGNLLSQFDPTYMYGSATNFKAACLLAPDPSCADLTLFAKVWIAMSLQSKVKQQIANAFGPSFATTGGSAPSTGSSSMRKSAVAQLNSFWLKFPQDVRQLAEERLEANRKIVAGAQGIHCYFQNGEGTNYEIDISKNIWEFVQTYDEAYPSLQIIR